MIMGRIKVGSAAQQPVKSSTTSRMYSQRMSLVQRVGCMSSARAWSSSEYSPLVFLFFLRVYLLYMAISDRFNKRVLSSTLFASIPFSVLEASLALSLNEWEFA